jgi:hypothetical protein
MKKLFYILPIASVLCLTNCGNAEHDQAHESATENNSVESSALNDTTKFKFDFAIANIPSPANRMQDIVALGIPYDNSFLHNSKQVGAYSTEFKKGINMGIYNMDMAYAMMNNAGQDVLNYLKTIIQLSDALGMQSSINSMVGKRFESNIDNKDSLFTVWDDILVKSDVYLRNNQRVQTAATVFTGSWLESLYLSCKAGDKLQDPVLREKIRTNLWEQRFHLGNLVKLLQDFKSDKDIQSLLAELEPIHAEIVAIKQPTDMGDEQMSSISSKIYAVREKAIL